MSAAVAHSSFKSPPVLKGRALAPSLPPSPHPGSSWLANELLPWFLQGVSVHFPHFWGSWIRSRTLVLCGEAQD